METFAQVERIWGELRFIYNIACIDVLDLIPLRVRVRCFNKSLHSDQNSAMSAKHQEEGQQRTAIEGDSCLVNSCSTSRND